MVETVEVPEGSVRVEPDLVRDLVVRLFARMGVPDGDAALIADVLVTADRRGIRSHGMARVPYFLDRMERGIIAIDPEMTFSRNTDTTGLLAANDGVGIVASNRAMDEAMAMARRHGSGWVGVKDSSHFGYAGFWADKAREQGFIGISMSNSGGRVAPTFGVEPLLGTNPLSVAIPGRETDFVLDMATSTVAVGKIETSLREGRPVPEEWVTEGSPLVLDERGILTFDTVLHPLGGEGTDHGGHKGYGLCLMVELLCGALTGTSFDARVAGASGESRPAMGHLMGAIRFDGFGERAAVEDEAERTFERLRASAKAAGQERIYIQGEPEAMAEDLSDHVGIVITPPVLAGLQSWAERLGVDGLTA